MVFSVKKSEMMKDSLEWLCCFKTKRKNHLLFSTKRKL